MYIRKPHRATGNPVGRPPSIPPDLGSQIMDALRRRVDPNSGLVKPKWKALARELGVSRSTIARQMAILYQFGMFERVLIAATPKIYYTYYRLRA